MTMLRSTRARLFAAVLVSAGCGGANGGGLDPTTNPPVNTTPGGTVSGKYLLRIEPARECAPPAPVLTFRMDARPDNGGPRPGIQVTLEFNPYMEMELVYTTPNVQGNIGTDYNLVASQELSSVPVWFHAIVTGSVTSENGGPGEILQGTMAGDVAFRDRDARCFSTNHRWSLRVR
jgi:hypothetical protein